MTPIEALYYIGYSLKKRYALAHRKRLPWPVVSVGNVTVGGTGKTPAVIALAEEALRRGFRPVILTRGYMGKGRGTLFVSRGAGPEMSAEDAGDEPVLIAERVPGASVVKCGDRHEGGTFALKHLDAALKGSVLFILDDGFQHFRLHRDRDVVLVNGTDPFGNGRLLPLGPLREPISALCRADLVVVTKVRNERLLRELARINGSARFHSARYLVTGVKGDGGTVQSTEWFRDKRVFGFCAIANPHSFRETISRFCGEVAGFETFRDHHRYTQRDVIGIVEESRRCRCDAVITTEKDMVKLRHLSLGESVYSVAIDFDVDDAFFEDLFRGLGPSATSRAPD